MAGTLSIAQRIANQLGPDLYTACIENDVARVEAASSSMASTNWSAAVLAAASGQATDVLTYCLQDKSKSGIMDDALWWILSDETLDPTYRFLVESKFVDVDREIDRRGSMLGVLAGKSKQKRHSLTEYLLKKGASPNRRVDMQGGLYALTVAAGYSDVPMLTLLVNHGARITGSGALNFAAQCGKEENVEYLLSKGAEVNEMVALSADATYRGDVVAPLHMAVAENHVGVIDLLLKSGADLKLKDSKGRTPADLAAERGADADMLAKLS